MPVACNDWFGVLRAPIFDTLEADMGKWADLAENLKKLDKQQLDDMNGFYGGGPTIENRIALADARAVNALAALMHVLAYLDAHDTKPPNAEITGG